MAVIVAIIFRNHKVTDRQAILMKCKVSFLREICTSTRHKATKRTLLRSCEVRESTSNLLRTAKES